MNYRLTITHPGKSLAFGNDHACGEFLQIWNTTNYPEPDGDNILVDEDRLTGFSKEKLIGHLAAHGFTESELISAKNEWHRKQTAG